MVNLGQKMMIRGLKEDGQCLPVAFLDCQTYMSSLKTFGATKLWLAADAWKGIWFGGFSVSPLSIYRVMRCIVKWEIF